MRNSNSNGACNVVYLALGEDLLLAIYTIKQVLVRGDCYVFDLEVRIGLSKTAKVVRSYCPKSAGETGKKLS